MPGSRAKKSRRAEPGTAPITSELEAWLAAFAEENDRIAACKKTGLQWRVVKAALADSKAFRTRYEDMMEEREVQIIDQHAKAGQSGNAAAGKAYLAAVGSRYARAGDDDDQPGSKLPDTDARDFARQIFGPNESEVN